MGGWVGGWVGKKETENCSKCSIQLHINWWKVIFNVQLKLKDVNSIFFCMICYRDFKITKKNQKIII
jgi:hypothetical protein